MKKSILFALLGLFVVSPLLADHPSISVTIDGKIYACSEGGSPNEPSCERAVKTFKDKLEQCLENYDGSYEKTGHCIPSDWAVFKRFHTDVCNYEASSVCFSVCVQHYDGSYEKTGQCRRICKLEN